MSGDSYDNTRRLDGDPLAARQVHRAVQRRPERRPLAHDERRLQALRAGRACLEVCPTGAIIRTEFDTVVIQSDVCNGCRDCIAACPFGVIGINDVSATSPRSARSATTGCRPGWSRPAPRPARPTRSSSARSPS